MVLLDVWREIRIAGVVSHNLDAYVLQVAGTATPAEVAAAVSELRAILARMTEDNETA
jgi:hypothetical protein